MGLVDDDAQLSVKTSNVCKCRVGEGVDLGWLGFFFSVSYREETIKVMSQRYIRGFIWQCERVCVLGGGRGVGSVSYSEETIKVVSQLYIPIS